jgi:hypothetical protein
MYLITNLLRRQAGGARTAETFGCSSAQRRSTRRHIAVLWRGPLVSQSQVARLYLLALKTRRRRPKIFLIGRDRYEQVGSDLIPEENRESASRFTIEGLL